MPQDHEVPPADAASKRPGPGRFATVIATLVAVASLIVAAGAWLRPDLPEWICTISEHRSAGCNDVPDEFLGEWTGLEKCHSQGPVVCVDPEIPVTVVIERGRKGQPVVTTRTKACEGRWTLTDVHGLTLSFHTESHPTIPLDGYPAPTGCPTGLLATLHINTAQHTLETSIRSGPDPGLWMAPNIELFAASLHKA